MHQGLFCYELNELMACRKPVKYMVLEEDTLEHAMLLRQYVSVLCKICYLFEGVIILVAKELNYPFPFS